MQYRHLIEKTLLSDKKVSKIFKVSLRTTKRWKQKNEAPHAVCLVLQHFIDGLNRKNTNHWNGWHLTDERLFSDEGFEFTAPELRAYAFMRHNGMWNELSRKASTFMPTSGKISPDNAANDNVEWYPARFAHPQEPATRAD